MHNLTEWASTEGLEGSDLITFLVVAAFLVYIGSFDILLRSNG
jgi:hypothetical protein